MNDCYETCQMTHNSNGYWAILPEVFAISDHNAFVKCPKYAQKMKLKSKMITYKHKMCLFLLLCVISLCLTVENMPKMILKLWSYYT